MTRRVILISVDSIGIDPLGHSRPESVYAQSRFLFPAGQSGDLIPLPNAPRPGALVETDVTVQRFLVPSTERTDKDRYGNGGHRWSAPRQFGGGVSDSERGPRIVVPNFEERTEFPFSEASVNPP